MDYMFKGEQPWRHVIRNDDYLQARLLLEDPNFGCGRQLVVDAIQAQAYNVLDAIAHVNPVCLFAELSQIGIPKSKLDVVLPPDTLVDIFLSSNRDLDLLLGSRFWLENPELLASIAAVGAQQFIDVSNIFLRTTGNLQYVQDAYQAALSSPGVPNSIKRVLTQYVRQL